MPSQRLRGPVDAWLQAGRQQAGVAAAESATRGVLVRRLALDLVGLPPEEDQLADLLSDEAPDAIERYVDRLLASPGYGERWGRHWMDVWRYSDWDGYGAEVRESQPHIWRWRDWIVESLNRDVGYNRMVMEMLAGDELSPDDPDTLRDRIPRPELVQIQSQRLARQHGRTHRQSVSRTDLQLRPLPRPHVRRDPPQRILRAASDFRTV